jgi:hypothetical protein
VKYVFLIPDGFGVRNFVLGSLLSSLSSDGNEIHIFHDFSDELTSTYGSGLDNYIHWHHLLPFRDTFASNFTRQSLAFAHMQQVRTVSMQATLRKPPTGSQRRKLLMRTAKLIGYASNRINKVEFLNRQQLRLFRKSGLYKQYLQLFSEIKPDVVFSSHQWYPLLGAPILAAQELGIPTATFIFSWDNLTSKGRVVAPFDHYLLWSELMQDELLRFYPLLTKANVHIVGTPQFEAYADKSLLLSREQFFANIKADGSRPLICYSGGHESTHPDEDKYLRLLMILVREERIKGNPQIIFRPAPTDRVERFDRVRADYPELLYYPPLWCYPRENETFYASPLPEDIHFLTNLLYHCDLNINLCSTMTIDFALFDKPVINPAFDLSNPLPHGLPLRDYYYQFDHYRPVVELGSVRASASPDEMVDDINRYLAQPDLDCEGRQELVRLQIGIPLGYSTQRVVQALKAIADPQSTIQGG